MAKPSIFSRDYEKIMRKRKKRRNIIVLLGVLTLSVSIIIIKYDIKLTKIKLNNNYTFILYITNLVFYIKLFTIKIR